MANHHSQSNHKLELDGGESEASTGSIKGSKTPSSKVSTDDLIGRTFLLPPQENGERLRVKVTKKVVQQ